jgi:tellurite methyltransferase
MSAGDRERWDTRYRRPGAARRAPSAFLCSLEHLLPAAAPRSPAPRALDVAGGAGRNAIWLARRALDVTLADVSPVALDLARAEAAAAGVVLRLLEVDLETEPLPPGPFDLIVSIDFLCRPLFAAFAAALAPGGLLVYLQPTRTNLERHASPSAAYLLEPGELPRLAVGLEPVRAEEGWFDDRHEARLVARRR